LQTQKHFCDTPHLKRLHQQETFFSNSLRVTFEFIIRDSNAKKLNRKSDLVDEKIRKINCKDFHGTSVFEMEKLKLSFDKPIS
jgi:hypothetical protein